MGLISFLFGKSNISEISDFLKRDAIIVDVRTEEEFCRGAISNSKNIPLQVLDSQLETIKSWNVPVIACCASGMRSSKAAKVLKKNGVDAINGGGWADLNSKL